MVEALRNVCLKFNRLAACCASVEKRGRSMSGNGTFLIRAQPRSSDAETLLIHKEMKTRGERERVSGRTEGRGGRRSSQSDTICSSTPTGSASILSSLTVCVYMWNWVMCQCQREEGCWVWSNTGVLANEKLKAQSRRSDETKLRKHCTIKTTQSHMQNRNEYS